MRCVRDNEHHARDAGVVAVWVAIMAPVLFGICAFAVDVARWYVEGARLQKAADAAALAGVTYMPFNLNVTTPSATSTARDYAARNGFITSGAGKNADITVTPGAKNTQVKVTLSSSVSNEFGKLFGIASTTIERTAVADFNGPAPMGSPCNTFGNIPPGTSGAPPVSSQLPASSACSATPQFWATIEGPATGKVQGDRYMTRTCVGTPQAEGCNGTATNNEYLRDGYYYVIRVLPDNTGQANTGAINVQLYDPAHVFQGPRCESLPNVSWGNNTNPFSPGNDASTRYDNSLTQYCTGDYDPGGSGTPPRLDTSFVLRAPTSTQDPRQAAVVDNSCIKQYRGYPTAPTQNNLRQGQSGYDASLASVFHQWTTLCTINNPVPGDYYLQVRTNVAMPTGSAAIATGNTAVANNSIETNTTGRGANSFAIRAFSSSIPSSNTRINVAGWERMPVFANLNSASPTFNLIRVPSAAAGKSLQFTFFDVADAGGSGSVTIRPPTDAAGTITTINSASSSIKCIGTGVVGGTGGTNLSGCSVGVTPSGNNGRLQTITVPIPTNYTCQDTSQTGCWFRVNFSFPGVTVNDISTWSASILGDPVRIVQ